MSQSTSKNRDLLKAILIVLSINLLITSLSFFIDLSEMDPTGKSISKNTLIPLPGGLDTEEERAEFLAEFQRAYNSNDAQQVVSFFGESEQAKIRETDYEKRVASLRTYASRVDEGVFTYYEVEDLGNGRYKFILHYNVTTDKGLKELSIDLHRQGSGAWGVSSITITPAK